MKANVYVIREKEGIPNDKGKDTFLEASPDMLFVLCRHV
jgi:hypothetical protein